MPTTTIDLIRHGEPVGGSRYRGQIDDPLSDKGWQQMRNAVADHCPWQRIVSSPLSRCADFATEVASRHELPLSFDERFMEIGFGDWEGQTRDQISAQDPQALQQFYQDPIQFRPPGAETLSAFQSRVVSAWDDLVVTAAGQQCLLVAHAGVIRMIILHLLGMPLERMFRLYVRNAGISRIRIDGEGADALSSLMFHDGRL